MNKKHSVLKSAVFYAVLLVFSASGCSVFSFGAKTNKKYNDEKMYTLGGQKIAPGSREDVYTDQEFGFGFITSDLMRELNKEGLLEILPQSTSATFFTLYSAKLHDLLASINPQALSQEQLASVAQEAEKYAFPAACLFRRTAAEPQGDDAVILDYIKENYGTYEKIAAVGGNDYYFACNTDYSKIDFSDTEKSQADMLMKELQDFKKNIFVFPPVSRTASSSGNQTKNVFTSFSANSLDGTTVTQDIFKDYKVTMINLWATWCSPCVREIPDLAKLHASMLPAGTNMMSICIDANDDPQSAKEILSAASARFTTLVPNNDLTPFLNSITSMPTTIFVDSQGNVIGKPIIGVPGREPAEVYVKTLSDLAEAH